MAGKIKVSEATVQKLRKGTMAGNLAKAKGASPELKEALIRFYGTKRVNAAIGKATVSKFPPSKMPVIDKSKKPVIQRGNPKPTPAELAAAKKKNATTKANAINASRMNPKPTQAQINAGKKSKSAYDSKVAAKNAVALKESRMNPKPTQAQLDRAKRAKIAGQAGSLNATRKEQKKPTLGQLNAAKNKKITDKKRADAYKERNKIARGPSTPASKISGDRYKRGL